MNNFVTWVTAKRAIQRLGDDGAPSTDGPPELATIILVIELVRVVCLGWAYIMLLWLAFEEKLLRRWIVLIWLALWCPVAPVVFPVGETWRRKWLGSPNWDGLYLLILTSSLVGMVWLWEKMVKLYNLFMTRPGTPVEVIVVFGFPVVSTLFYYTILFGEEQLWNN